MNLLKLISTEALGLFIDDGNLAFLSLLLVALVTGLVKLIGLPPLWGGLLLLVGSMVGTSLGVAPALLLAGRAAFVDLDGPLLLARDRPDGLHYEDARLFPPELLLWG